MTLSKQELLGVLINTDNKERLLKKAAEYLNHAKNTPLTIVTPNPEQIVYAQKDKHFRDILNTADISLPDGVGIVWALKISTIKKIPGIEFMEDLVKLAAQKGQSVGLIGGRQGVAQKALQNLQKKYSGLTGWTEDGPEMEVENSKIKIQNHSQENYFQNLIAKIKKHNTKLLFIGLGVPKQEYFITTLKTLFNTKLKQSIILMSVGGAFDIFAGWLPRAPKLLRELGLEWVWRLILEPWRIKRQLKLITFVNLVLTSRK